MQILLDEKFATVSFIPELKELRIVWKPVTMALEEYQKAFNTGLEFQKSHDIINFLSDTREQKVISPAFRKWFQDFAVPLAKKQGLKRGAVVTTGNVFKKYYLNNILNTVKRFGIELKFFGDMQSAENWFKSAG